MAHPKKHIIVFALLTIFFWFSQYIFVPYLSPYATQLGASDFIIGIMVGIYGLAQIFIRIPLGILSDRLNNRKLFIMLGCMVGIFGTMGLYLVPSIWLIILMRFLTGVAASSWVCFSVLFSSYFSPGESVRAQGLLVSFNYTGQTLGYLTAIFITNRFGLRSTFLGAFFATIVASVLSIMIMEKKSSQKRVPLTVKQILSAMKDKWLIIISVLGLIFQILTFAVPLGFTSKLATQLGAKNSDLAWLTLVFTLPAIPAAFLAGPLLGKRFGKRNSLLFSATLMSVCCCLQPFCKTVFALIIVQTFLGLGRGICYPMLMGLSIEKTPYEKQAAAMGFFQAVYSIGIMFGPIIAGAVSNLTTLPTAFFFIGALGLLSPVISLVFIRNDKKYPLADSLR